MQNERHLVVEEPDGSVAIAFNEEVPAPAPAPAPPPAPARQDCVRLQFLLSEVSRGSRSSWTGRLMSNFR